MYRCDICDSRGDSFYGYNSFLGYCDKKECKREADSKEYNFCYENVMYDAKNGNTPDYEEVEVISR